MGILTKESRLVLEDEDENNETISEGVDGDDESVWMDGEDEPPDDLRYNGEVRENCYMNREHAEDSFESNNHNISKVRS